MISVANGICVKSEKIYFKVQYCQITLTCFGGIKYFGKEFD